MDETPDGPETARSRWALRESSSLAPEPLECLLRSVFLPPLLVLGFWLSPLTTLADPDPEFLLFMGLIGLLAGPVGFAERWLHRRGRTAQVLVGGLLLPLVLGFLALLLFLEARFLHSVYLGARHSDALGLAYTQLQETTPVAAAFMLPIAFPFVGALFLRLGRVRRRWLTCLLPLLSLPPGALLLELIGGPLPSEHWALFTGVVLTPALLLPLSQTAAAASTRAWRRRRDGLRR